LFNSLCHFHALPANVRRDFLTADNAYIRGGGEFSAADFGYGVLPTGLLLVDVVSCNFAVAVKVCIK
jgi:hypothetical protein